MRVDAGLKASGSGIVRCAACALALCFAASLFTWGCAREEVPPRPSGVNPGIAVQLDPVAEERDEATRLITLYFYRYLDEELLISESRPVQISPDVPIEKAAIDELLRGPKEGYNMQRSIPTNTKCLSVSVGESPEVLNVVLSDDFLELPPDAPENWAASTAWSNRILTRRRLAVYSIVNTVTELGNYHQVLLLVNHNTHIVPLQYEDFETVLTGLGDMRPLGRDPLSILTPGTLMDRVMRCLKEGAFDTLVERYIAQVDDDHNSRPPSSEMIDALTQTQGLLFDDSSGLMVGESTVSENGQTATAWVEFDISNREGQAVQTMRRAVRLRRESGIWKITWKSLVGLLEW